MDTNFDFENSIRYDLPISSHPLYYNEPIPFNWTLVPIFIEYFDEVVLDSWSINSLNSVNMNTKDYEYLFNNCSSRFSFISLKNVNKFSDKCNVLIAFENNSEALLFKLSRNS